MVEIEGLLFCSKEYYEMFKGQDRSLYGAALADGVLWVCKMWERSTVLVDLLEKLFSYRLPLIYWPWPSSSACHYVELLLKLDINVMSSICAS